MVRRIAIIAVMTTALVLTASSLLAHGGLSRADPAPGSALGASPKAVRLFFSERPEASLCEIAVVDLKGAAYEYEPDEETILATLLPRNITVQLFSAMLENDAGFYAAQMAAMDNATRNAGDMIAALNLSYNRQRQAQITTELIEIISGASAL